MPRTRDRERDEREIYALVHPVAGVTMKNVEARRRAEQLLGRSLPSWVKVKSVRQTSDGIVLEGSNPHQDFVEIFDSHGDNLGMILRVKGEKFWSVWKAHQVVTVPVSAGRWRTIGSTNKATAMQKLRQIIRSG